MRQTDRYPALSNFYHIRPKPMRIKPITPIQLLKIAYDEAGNAVEFCNWYINNRPYLERHEKHLIDLAYRDGVKDAIQDPDHISKPGEYFTDNYDRTND